MSVSTEGKRQDGGLAENGRVVFQALLIALAIRILLFQPFSIPSGSMKATLLIGDYLFVSQYSYGYSRYSLPFSPPLFSGRIFGSPPERGDVVVFRLPKDDSSDYIKRVVGLPATASGWSTGCFTSTACRSSASASPISSTMKTAAPTASGAGAKRCPTA